MLQILSPANSVAIERRAGPPSVANLPPLAHIVQLFAASAPRFPVAPAGPPGGFAAGSKAAVPGGGHCAEAERPIVWAYTSWASSAHTTWNRGRTKAMLSEYWHSTYRRVGGIPPPPCRTHDSTLLGVSWKHGFCGSNPTENISQRYPSTHDSTKEQPSIHPTSQEHMELKPHQHFATHVDRSCSLHKRTAKCGVSLLILPTNEPVPDKQHLRK